MREILLVRSIFQGHQVVTRKVKPGRLTMWDKRGHGQTANVRATKAKSEITVQAVMSPAFSSQVVMEKDRYL